MYHVLALLIIWIYFLYNFDNKHTFIVIVIVIIISNLKVENLSQINESNTLNDTTKWLIRYPANHLRITVTS